MSFIIRISPPAISVLSVNPRFRDLYRDLTVPSHLFLKSDFPKFIIN